jgi:hypothetical protein
MGVDGAEPVRRKIKEIVPEYSYQSNDLPNDSAARRKPAVLQQAAGRG